MNIDTVAVSVASAAFGGVGWLIRGAFGRVNDRVERVEVRTDKTESELSDLREKSVQREDFIRETARTRQTLERLVEGQARMEGKIEMCVRCGVSGGPPNG